jgi:D-amino-acid dehydrogenase
MKITILGAGVIGVTSAYYLSKAGHDVTIVERKPAPALETSFANAAQVSFGYCSPWAAPGIPQKALKWLFMKHAPLILRPKLDFAMLSWMAKMLSNCTAERYAINKSRMLRLADYSRVALAEVRHDTGIHYDSRMQGTLQLFRTQAQLDASAKDVKALAADGIPYELLDREGCIEREPALAVVRDRFVGGLLTPKDETGDCFKFTQALAERAQAMGVVMKYGVNVKLIRTTGDRVTGVDTEAGPILSDAVVAAMGSYTPLILKPLEISLPVYPVKGYSLTIPIADATRAPQSTVMDETYKIAITRLGERIRVGGMAEISGFNNRLDMSRRDTLEYSVSDLFPGGDLSRATFWSGLRPMTPDGTPVIGRAKFRNLYLNTGHGTLGWTMSCGSAKLLTDLISGNEPEIEAADLAISRYS